MPIFGFANVGLSPWTAFMVDSSTLFLWWIPNDLYTRMRYDETARNKLESIRLASGFASSSMSPLERARQACSVRNETLHTERAVTPSLGLTTITAFGIALLAFILQQRFSILMTKEARVFPVQCLRSKTFILLQSCAQTALAVPLYYIPLFFQFARSETAVRSALRLLPFVIVNILAVFSNGFFLANPKLSYYSAWLLTSSLLTTIGGALFFGTLKASTSLGAIYGYSILIAPGAGLA
ncbi:hypothetical protein CC80DRAFT_572764 [Byssothecium circinans]|uniref:MFS general substrate transporter n=1 Tax=Byssothecium circinans TaxID=147558 RepID=A0A6A5THR9_9PLEO|nr:hypothetical protein CC80DRAFT_572764 [Byssothecium circinans]